MDQYDPAFGMNGFSQTCSGCRRTCAHLTAFSNHLASCTQRKRKLADALVMVQGVYREKKRKLLENVERATGIEPPSNPLLSGLTLVAKATVTVRVRNLSAALHIACLS
jgi:hypothetical protein